MKTWIVTTNKINTRTVTAEIMLQDGDWIKFYYDRTDAPVKLFFRPDSVELKEW